MNTDEDELRVGLDDLSQRCHCSVELIVALVHEGALEPQAGAAPAEWTFDVPALLRARRAVRLAHDLELNPPGVALALQLLEEIQRLRAALGGRG